MVDVSISIRGSCCAILAGHSLFFFFFCILVYSRYAWRVLSQWEVMKRLHTDGFKQTFSKIGNYYDSEVCSNFFEDRNSNEIIFRGLLMISSGHWLLFLMDGISLETVNENLNLMIILLTGPSLLMLFTLLLAIAYHL